MNNAASLSMDFERQKNTRAALYTAAVTGTMMLLIFLVRFSEPADLTPPADEYIEINLGSSDVGAGNDQPELPGEPAPEQQTAYTPAQAVVQTSNEAARDIEESDDRDAAPVYKPAATKPNATKINEETKVVSTTSTAAATPTPPAPRPRAVMGQVRGGDGNGGNGAATYRPGTGEGQGGGPGDQGSVGGNPNGRDYTPRRLAVRTVSIPTRSFEDDFKESGKIVLEIVVDENGKLLATNFQPRGSSISNRGQIDIAKRRARELSFPKYPGGFKQNVEFQFEVKN